MLNYKSQKQNEGLKALLIEPTGERRHFDYRRLHILAEREGLEVNHKQIHRLYRRRPSSAPPAHARAGGRRAPSAGVSGQPQSELVDDLCFNGKHFR